MMEIVNNYSFFINTFLTKCGVYRTTSLCRLITWIKIDYNFQCKIQFGSSVQNQEENNPTNNIDVRTIEEIMLGPYYSLYGGYKLLNLLTGGLIS